MSTANGLSPAECRAAVAESLAALPTRYRLDRAPESVRRYLLRIGDAPPSVVLAGPQHCRLAPSVPAHVDAELWMDADAWLELDAGRTTGPQAFFDGRISLRGDLNEALRLETLFSHPHDLAAPRLWQHTHRGGAVVVHEAGPLDGLPVVAVHGLGASKVSLLPAIAGLAAKGYRVITPDLPGFGASDAVSGAAYDMPAFADAVLATLDAAGVERGFVVGNSLGGRVAVETALAAPSRVSGLGLLCPAVAFDEYARVRPLLRALRADVAFGLLRWPRLPGLVDHGIRRMLADPARMPADNLTAARDDFLRSMRHSSRRLALLSTARTLALEEPVAFWERLGELATPSLWLFGERDRLVSPDYAHQVRCWLPHADVRRWDDCGHVPQFEHPDATVQALHEAVAATTP